MTAEHHDGHGGDHESEIHVSADALGGSNATGGYGDESTGLSDAATADEAPHQDELLEHATPRADADETPDEREHAADERTDAGAPPAQVEPG